MFPRLKTTLLATLLASSALAGLSGCAQFIPHPKVQQPPEQGRVTFKEEQPVVELPVKADDLLSVSYDKGDPLPGDLIGPVEVQDMPLQDVLRLVTRENKITVALGSGAEDQNVSISIPDKLPLAKIVDLLVGQADSFYTYRDGVLHVEGERTYSLRVPNVLTQTRYKDLTAQEKNKDDENDSKGLNEGSEKEAPDPANAFSTIDAFAKSFTDLGASDVSANNRSGLITFKANKDTYSGIAKFLREFETNRNLIIYDAWIYEVQLSDEKKAGIDWSSFGNGSTQFVSGTNLGLNPVDGVSMASAASTAAGAGSVTLGVIGTPGAQAFQAMFSFLSGQGEAKTLAQPTISVIGGRESDVFVGESVGYVKSIKLVTDNNDDGTTDNNDSDTADVQTRQLQTGIRLGITGDVTNNVVETDIGLSFVELLELANVDVKGWLIQLPHTAERSLNTTIRSRPGDVIMLGGLIYDRGQRNQNDVTFFGIPYKAEAKSDRRELVMMLRPRVIKFRTDKVTSEKAFQEAPIAIGPAQLPAKDSPATKIVTPKAPAEVQMQKSVTDEQRIIDGIKAAPIDPEEPAEDDLVNQAKQGISEMLAPDAPAPMPAPAKGTPTTADAKKPFVPATPTPAPAAPVVQ